MRPLVVLAASVLAWSPIVPVEAFGHHEQPLLATASGTGAGWVSVKMTTDGGPFSVWLFVDGAVPYYYGGRDWIVRDGVDEWSSAWWGRLSSEQISAGAGTDLVGPTRQHLDAHRPAGSARLGVIYNEVDPGQAGWSGTIKLVMWLGGRGGTGWTAEVRGVPGTTLEGAETGEAFVFETSDFGGTASAGVTAGLPSTGANLGGEVLLDVEHALYGLFDPSGIVVGDMRVTGPDGENGLCPCWLDEPWGRGAGGPGRYTFTLDGAWIDPFPAGPFLVGADAVVPP